MLGLAVGVAQWITGSAPQPIADPTYVAIFGGGDFGPVPGLLVWTALAVAIGWVVMNRTRYGRRVLATGGNPTAAAYTGIRTARIKFLVLLTSGTVAALAGMLYAGRLESGRFQWGQGDELTVIAAVILGGTSLFGGRGAIIGTLFGSLFMGLINNGLILAGLEVAQQQVVRGAIIIAAVALSRKR
jgi:ribose transport system permease protein